MESSQTNELYLDYFKLRNIDRKSYANYTLPHYLRKHLPKDKNVRTLDVGCGFGQLLNAMKQNGYTNLTGIDVSKDAIAHCKELGVNATLVTGVEDFTVPEEKKFDLIIMSHVLEHIPKEHAIATVKHIKDHLLKPGGSFMLMVPNAQSYTGAYWMYEDFTHYTLYTSGSVIYVLGAAGFNDIQFLDKDGSESAGTWYGKFLRKTFTKIYDLKVQTWNKLLHSHFYAPSPRIYTFELKVLAK